MGSDHTELLKRSPLGLVKVYNSLPQHAVDKGCVSTFQGVLQDLVKEAARNQVENWHLLLSPRCTWRDFGEHAGRVPKDALLSIVSSIMKCKIKYTHIQYI